VDLGRGPGQQLHVPLRVLLAAEEAGLTFDVLLENYTSLCITIPGRDICLHVIMFKNSGKVHEA